MYFTSEETGVIKINISKNGVNATDFEKEMTIYKDLNDFDFLRFEDFTGDNQNEILIPYNLAPSHENFNYYLLEYNSKNGKLNFIDGFENLWHPEYDKTPKIIHSLSEAGIGSYIAQEHQLSSNELILKKEIHSNWDKVNDIQNISTYLISADTKKLVKTERLDIKNMNFKYPYFWENYYKNED